MGQQDINSATVTTTITGSDSVFISKNDNALQKIDYDLLAKAIIEQYTGSTLGGSARSLKTAIDALNSKFISGEWSDIAYSTPNEYTEVASFTIPANRRALVYALSIYATGRPTGIRIMDGTTKLYDVENENYTKVFAVVPIYSRLRDVTYTIEEKLSTNGVLTGQYGVILF